MKPAEAARLEQAQQVQEENKWQIAYDPITGKGHWVKHGEQSVPIISDQPLAGSTPGGGTPPGGPQQPPPVPPQALPPQAGGQNVPVQPPGQPPQPPPPPPPAAATNPIDGLKYQPPSASPDSGPGPVFNPKTGMPDPVAQAASKKSLEDARASAGNASKAAVQLGELETQLNNIDKLTKDAGGFLQPGLTPPSASLLRRELTALAPLGIQPFDPSLVGSAEAAGKLTTR